MHQLILHALFFTILLLMKHYKMEVPQWIDFYIERFNTNFLDFLSTVLFW